MNLEMKRTNWINKLYKIWNKSRVHNWKWVSVVINNGRDLTSNAFLLCDKLVNKRKMQMKHPALSLRQVGSQVHEGCNQDMKASSFSLRRGNDSLKGLLFCTVIYNTSVCQGVLFFGSLIIFEDWSVNQCFCSVTIKTLIYAVQEVCIILDEINFML